MDTATHFVMGIALGGLALADPVVALDPASSSAVMIGVIAGSQAPDIDTVLKLRNNAVYIRNHRGITHSIPAVLLWPIFISSSLHWLMPDANWLHVWLWTFLAVFLHVFVDIFNSYGTQALRPFSKKWIALNVINTFDPIIFAAHTVALLLWAIGLDPVIAVGALYAFLFAYYIVRFAVQAAVRKAVRVTLPEAKTIIVAPTIRFFQWRIAASSDDCYFVGRAYGRAIHIYDRFERSPLPDSPLVQAALQDVNASAFLSFSPMYRWEISRLGSLSELRLIDLRYRSNDYYPFVAVVHLDDELRILNSYTGWIFSEDKLRKKMQVLTG